MNPGAITNQKRAAGLMELLRQLASLHKDLSQLLEQTLEAIRRADVPAMHRLDQDARQLAARIAEREGLRRQLTRALIGTSRLAGRESDGAADMVEQCLPPPLQTEFRKAVEHLRSVVRKAAALNGLVTRVATDVLIHLRWVFQAVRPAAAPIGGYADNGLTPVGGEARIFDTVG